MITIKEINVHFFTPESREEVDLEFRWFNDIP